MHLDKNGTRRSAPRRSSNSGANSEANNRAITRQQTQSVRADSQVFELDISQRIIDNCSAEEQQFAELFCSDMEWPAIIESLGMTEYAAFKLHSRRRVKLLVNLIRQHQAEIARRSLLAGARDSIEVLRGIIAQEELHPGDRTKAAKILISAEQQAQKEGENQQLLEEMAEQVSAVVDSLRPGA